MSSTPSDGQGLPLRPALKGTDTDEPMSPKTGPTKVVSIAPEPENIPPISPPEEFPRVKQFKAGVGDYRMTGRPIMPTNSSSRLSIYSQSSIDEPMPASDTSGTPQHTESKRHSHHHGHQSTHTHEKLLAQVGEWLHAEKQKRAAKKARKRGNHTAQETTTRSRTSSQSSDSSEISLERLQRILEGNLSNFSFDSQPTSSPTLGPRRLSHAHRRRSSTKLGKLGASSDTEYQDGDVMVPSCDVILDNSKTMSYTGGESESSGQTVTLGTSKRVDKEQKAWLSFKNEIVRLTHTLRLKGWRRVPLERGGEIEVERLSGALTNAVYVVSPPKELDLLQAPESGTKTHSPKPPPKLLLRVYGPQVEHLIDRENELGILRRLARKKIGPRMLGTFTNGRFEEFFNAQTLTAADLRVEATSKQIAKRMRELHDGMELLEREREEGPFVWLNWDKWVERCEEVITYLDKEILTSKKKGKGELWRKRGLVCGVEWPLFKATIDKYRKWLDDYYGKAGVFSKLVFAHNDTQYGNILRLVPVQTAGSAPSPLLMPENTHKQLVVIDFEYASANTPGLEFANHFTEWCYNYHDPVKAWACNTDNYPTLEQQKAFIRSYVNHRPQFNPRASSTPKLNAMDGLAKGSISEFLLDSRTPGGSTTDLTAYNYAEDEARRERETQKQVDTLLHETRVWRIANSAQWVAWGIVQAKVPELDGVAPGAEAEESGRKENMKPGLETNGVDKRPEGLKAEALLSGNDAKEAEVLDDAEDEFDYLAYAQDRAMFFWGDVVGLGLVDKADLPSELVARLKIVDH